MLSHFPHINLLHPNISAIFTPPLRFRYYRVLINLLKQIEFRFQFCHGIDFLLPLLYSYLVLYLPRCPCLSIRAPFLLSAYKLSCLNKLKYHLFSIHILSTCCLLFHSIILRLMVKTMHIVCYLSFLFIHLPLLLGYKLISSMSTSTLALG